MFRLGPTVLAFCGDDTVQDPVPSVTGDIQFLRGGCVYPEAVAGRI